MNQPPWRWVSEEVALAIHDAQIAEHGGAPGVRDPALLQSALDRARNLAAYDTPDAAGLAAAYAFGLGRNHPFVDGNKRTAFVVACVFLLDNGAELTATDAESVRAMLSLAAGNMKEAAFADWIRANIRPLEDEP